MSPAFKTHSRTLFSAVAAVLLGLQVTPEPCEIKAQENAPAPLIIQAAARPIGQPSRREQRLARKAKASAEPGPLPPELLQPPQEPPPGQPQQQYQQPSQRRSQQRFQPRANTQQQPKSEVQKELEKLYEQNGRELPEMDYQEEFEPDFAEPAAPAAPPAPVAPAAPVAPVQVAPPQNQNLQAAPAAAPKKKNFFSKLFSKNDGPTQPPVEPPYVPPVAARPMTPPAAPGAAATGLPNYGQIFNQEDTAAAGTTSQPSQQFEQQQQPNMAGTQQNQSPALNAAPTSADPANDGFEAPLFVETPQSQGNNGIPAIDFNAPLQAPVGDSVDLGQSSPLSVADESAEPIDPFSEAALFPGSNAPATAAPTVVADNTATEEMLPAEEEAPLDENPYSGLTLDEDPFSNPSALRSVTATPRKMPIEEAAESPDQLTPPAEFTEDPYVAEDRPAQEPVDPTPEEGADEPPLVVENSDVTPPSQLKPVPRSGSERTRAKQEMIAARKGLRGLKGFCPVVLREDRDLVDAHSQFRASYNDKIYYLSSSQAVSAFLSDPAKYAPAARGCDVIHQALTGEEFEGTLDFAVWYKGRLYLFSSAETMDTFVSAPSSLATLD